MSDDPANAAHARPSELPARRLLQGLIGGDRPRAITLAVLSLLAIVATGTGVSLYKQLNELRAAPQDSVQWSLTQLETDLLRLDSAIRQAQTGDGAIAAVRRRFDLFYSRVQTVRQGPVFAELREIAPVRRHLRTVQAFLDDTAPRVDAGPAALERRLDTVHRRVDDLLPVVRDVALEGVRLYAAQSDARRRNFVNALMTAAAVAFGLILLLAVTLAVLDRQHRVSLRRAAEVRHSRDRLSATIGAALDAVVVTDAGGRIVDWNGAAERIFGYTRDRALGAEMAALIGPAAGPRAIVPDDLDGARAHAGEAGRFETRGRDADGRWFPVEMAQGVSRGPDGPIFISYLRDISDRVAQQDALVAARDEALAAERAKTDFLAVMSHEMRTPLNGLLGVLDLLERTQLDQSQRRYVATAAGSGEILLKHINDVLDVTRVEAGKMAFQAEPVDLKAILEETRLIAAPLAEHNGNDAVITGDPTAPWVLGDPHRLRQVLLNLVSNAAKFTRRGRVALDLTVRERGPGTAAVELAVVDDGPGIPPADRARIFDDFVTLDSGYDRNTGGSGLGLAISRRIVRAMGGEIGVDPGPGGTGSRFWIRLALPYAPAAGDPAAPGAGRAAPEASPAGRRLLLVEDNEVNRMVAGEMLRQAGHAVTEAADGTAGIAAAAQRRFDLILMDVSMPGMDGIEATQAIRRGRGASRDSPVVALTAHALPEDRRRFAEAGMREVIVKPLRRADLLAAVARYPAADPDAAPPAPAPAAGGARAHADEGADRGTDLDADKGADWDADWAPDEDEDAEPDPLDQLFDTDVLSDLSFTLSPDALGRTLAKVRAEIDEALARVEDAAAARDDAALAHWVHRLAGCAAMVGARALHAACGEVEAACKRGAGAHARTRAGDLPELVAGSQAILAELAEDAAATATAP